MKATTETLKTARQLLLRKDHGVFSSISVKLDGMPFGSVMTYCLDGRGYPVALFSTIAQHTMNVQADSRCSLTILEGKGHDPQAESRLTISGHLMKVEEEQSVSERFFRYFPKAESYREFHDFDFYVMEPTAVRYIGGFGKIHWLDLEEFFVANPFDTQTEKGMITHMNDHHHDSLFSYFKSLKHMDILPSQDMRMCGIDQEGFDIIVDGIKHRFDTDDMPDAMTARKVLTALA